VRLLIDTQRGSIRPLIDAPTNWEGSFAWSSNGTSVVVGGSFLPLDIDDPSEREMRKTTTWAAEVDVKSGGVLKIKEGNYHVLKWNWNTNTVLLKPVTMQSVISSVERGDDQPITFHKNNDHWEKVSSAEAGAAGRTFDVQEEQDMNTPPRLFLVNHLTGDKVLLLDLNPQFHDVRFGRVQEITWKGTDGSEYSGGIYLPPDFVPGCKYPLVMQAYGWTSSEFWIDGPATSGFAAQALAGKGIVVAQLRYARELGTLREGPLNTAMREGLIDELARKGIIDPDRVGLMGFSRAGYATWYMLAFSKYPIAAAAVVAGNEGGYLEYLAGFSARAGGDYEGQNGSPPYGEGLQMWLRNAPGFNLDKIRTPIREVSFAQDILLNWEPFVGLKRLGRPVELVWLPDAAHELVKPLERITAQQGNVDWFCFWLKGEEDVDPMKAEQYARWRELRKLQEQNARQPQQANPPSVH
jgi:hypothetical protein